MEGEGHQHNADQLQLLLSNRARLQLVLIIDATLAIQNHRRKLLLGFLSLFG
jgi:hypothetical protein